MFTCKSLILNTKIFSWNKFYLYSISCTHVRINYFGRKLNITSNIKNYIIKTILENKIIKTMDLENELV